MPRTRTTPMFAQLQANNIIFVVIKHEKCGVVRIFESRPGKPISEYALHTRTYIENTI